MTIDCRGATEFGSSRKAPGCYGTRTLTRYRAGKLRTYREADRTYECRPCLGLHRTSEMARRASRDSAVLEKLAAADHDAIVNNGVRSWELVAKVLAAQARLRPLPRQGIDQAAARRGMAARRDKRARLGLAEKPRGDRISAGKWRTGTNVEIRQCAWCELLLMVSLAPKAHRPIMHQPCMIEAMRSPEVRRWLSKRRQMRDDGVPAFRINRRLGADMPVPRHGRLSDPEVLTRHFNWAVAVRLGNARITDLALEADVDPSTVSRAVNRVVSLLPPADFADGHFRPIVEKLRATSSQGDHLD